MVRQRPLSFLRRNFKMPKLALRSFAILVPAVGAALLSGCMPLIQQGYPVGGIYSGTKAPSSLARVETSGDNKTAPKMGSACSSGILGLVAWGDASIDAAKKAGGITSVHSIEYEATAVLGAVYVEACTVVHGS
jgi:hypothetical protein